MTLQSSGTIRMSEINTELGRSSTAQISLDSAENGSYATINTNSTSRPSSTNPAAMSEWYGYNHNATPPGYARSLYWTNASYYYGYGINLFISLNSNTTVLVNDTLYDYGINSGTTGYTTGDSALFVNEGSTGGYYAYQVLQVYDGNLGYIVNQTAGTSDPYLYSNVSTDSSYGSWDITSYIESL